ncbi:pdz domain related [Cystoisospora suis]|uniref:Pdz domain related n=1 Tax=Cystoisospora suis TaxID=483139 RepID=A0A2C6JMX5_9APIC|nr:pdz domain related [Cystoisospora suis]
MPTGLAIGANDEALGGCYVAYVAEDSKAQKAGIRAGDQIVAAGEKVLLARPLKECLDALTFPERPYPLPRNTRLPSIRTLFFRGCLTDLYGAKAFIHLEESGRLQDIFESVPSYYALRHGGEGGGEEEDSHFLTEDQNLSLHEKMVGKLRLDKAFGRNPDLDEFIKRGEKEEKHIL